MISVETQATFVCRAILGWRPISKQGGQLNIKADVVSQLNSLAAVKQANLTGSLPVR